MANRDDAIRALCQSLGKEYTVTTIDFERVIYRDFGNGFNVEISGVYNASKNKNATIYLWYGTDAPSCFIVDTVKNVSQDNIGKEVEKLFDYSKTLLASGLDTRDKLFRWKHPNLFPGGKK